MKSNLRRQAQKGLNINLHRFAAWIDRKTNSVLKESNLDITNAQYLIIKSIYILEYPTQAELADYLSISPAAVSRHCLILSEKGYILVTANDGRTNRLELTKLGYSIFRKSLNRLQKYLKEELSDYDQIAETIWGAKI